MQGVDGAQRLSEVPRGCTWCPGVLTPFTSPNQPPAPPQSWVSPGDPPSPGEEEEWEHRAPLAVERQGEQGCAGAECSATHPLLCPQQPMSHSHRRSLWLPRPSQITHLPPRAPSQCLLQTHSIPLPWHSTQCWLLGQRNSSPALSSKHPKALN